MTNEEIIIQAALAEKLFTEKEIAVILATGNRLPLHTFSEWKRLGFSVKRGEKARLTTTIWKWTSKPLKKDEAPAEDAPECECGHFYLSKAHFFTTEQVERIKEANTNA